MSSITLESKDDLASKREQRTLEKERRRQELLTQQTGLSEEERKASLFAQLEVNATFKSLSSRTKYERTLEAIGMSELPASLTRRVNGSTSYGVPYAIWQIDLIKGAIEQGAEKGYQGLSHTFACAWLAQRFHVQTEFANSHKVAVWQFLVFLAEQGFLRRRPGKWFQTRISRIVDMCKLLKLHKEVGPSGIIPYDWFVWVDEQSWPTREHALRVAQKYAGVDGHCDSKWEQLAALHLDAREFPVENVVSEHALNGIIELEAIEYLLVAGYVTQAPAPAVYA